MEVLEAIRTRRSIRKYKSKPVEEKTLATVLEAARQAPSWANTQCWRFVVVRDGAIKSKLSNTLNETNPARDAVCNAPLVIVACAEMGKSGHKDGEAVTDKGDWFMFDVALAMQNLVLAAHSLGLGTVYVGRFDAGEVGRILSLPQGYCAVAMTPLGYPDETKEPRPRKELEEIVHYDKWGPE
ncbi:MAG TPA: nitroreductase family protein [Dehalococcoidales bacterium]|nr:nitroreductase family protein [Dehalococcoidales bacterium]